MSGMSLVRVPILNDDKSSSLSLESQENIAVKSSTFSVLKLSPNVNDPSEEQLANINFMSLTLEVSHELRFREVKLIHSWNIEWQLVTYIVLRYSMP